MEIINKIKELSEQVAQDIVDMTFLDKEEIALKVRIKMKELVKELDKK